MDFHAYVATRKVGIMFGGVASDELDVGVRWVLGLGLGKCGIYWKGMMDVIDMQSNNEKKPTGVRL